MGNQGYVSPFHRWLVTIAGCVFVSSAFCSPLFAQTTTPIKERTPQVRSIADGELRACQILSLDRSLAVGDRGLILLSTNGGKNWSVQHHRTEDTLYGVHFSSELQGCAVGGTIEAYTHRSKGTVLVTSDGGTTWSTLQNSSLPRLTGVASGGGRRIVAWGDWSIPFQSALFESFDGGVNWNPIPIPCGHLQSVAVGKGPSGQNAMVLLDRLSRCFITWDGIQFEPLTLPTSPFEPLHYCSYQSNTWWIGGSKGQLFRSIDGKAWERLFLPGTPKDHELITLDSVACYGDHVWVAGQPGCVVWHSNDRGFSWNVRSTGLTQPIHQLHAWNDSILMGAGRLTSIVQSRNGGQAWWTTHRSGERIVALNFASDTHHVAWDALASVSNDARHHVSSIVVHDQNLEQKSGYRPEHSQRSGIASAFLGLAGFESWPFYPVSNAYDTFRKEDLNHYAGQGSLHAVPETELIRRMVLEIRLQRPSVLLTDCPITGSPLQTKLSEAVDLAAAWSSRRDLQLFSESSGINVAPHSVPRTLYRGTKPGGIQFHASKLLQSSGTLLGEYLYPIHGLVHEFDAPNRNNTNDKITYRTIGAKNSTLRDVLEGLTIDSKTQKTERPLGGARTAAIMATSTWFDIRSFVESNNSNPFVRNREWEQRVLAAMKSVEPSARSPVLLEIAHQNRLAGSWNHWSSALEILLVEDKQSPYAEAALRESMRFLGSAEVHRWNERLQSEHSAKNTTEQLVTYSESPSSTPFSKQSDLTTVQHASFAHAPQWIPLLNQGGLPEFQRLLGKFPDEWIAYRSEPEWAWLIASRFRATRAMNATKGSTEDYSVFWPVCSPNLLEWKALYESESEYLTHRELTNRQTSAQHVKRIASNSERPHLDGIANDAIWLTAQPIVLRDPWDSHSSRTEMRIAFDSEFLYLHCYCPSEPKNTTKPVASRERDSLSSATEQVRVRIDTDRDYCSWFELGFNRHGETVDLCNDMIAWNPDWYLASQELPNGWQAEIAIPISELTRQFDPLPSHMTVWGVNAVHMVPEKGTRSVAPSVSDRFQRDQWTLVELIDRPSQD